MSRPSWEDRLRDLVTGGSRGLEGGAELEVRDHAGTVVFLAPLARHYRLEEDLDVVWVRPIVGGYLPDQSERGVPGYAFSLNEARARALATAEVHVEADGVVFVLPSEQVARIRPAGPETRPELERWDSFVYGWLSADEEGELERVWGDSWQGRWA